MRELHLWPICLYSVVSTDLLDAYKPGDFNLHTVKEYLGEHQVADFRFAV